VLPLTLALRGWSVERADDGVFALLAAGVDTAGGARGAGVSAALGALRDAALGAVEVAVSVILEGVLRCVGFSKVKWRGTEGREGNSL
jgi:hypothetical protein